MYGAVAPSNKATIKVIITTSDTSMHKSAQLPMLPLAAQPVRTHTSNNADGESAM